MRINRNPISYGMLKFRKWHLGKMKTPRDKKIHGFDTETLDGYCRLLADDTGEYVMGDSIEPFLEFLTSRRFRDTHNFFFNQRYDFQAIIKYLDRDILKELYETGSVKYNDYLFYYIPKKLFKITKSKHVYPYYDVMQFYHSSLATASERYLNEQKNIDDLDVGLIGTSPQYWKDNEPQIIKYCIRDAWLCKRLGDKLHETLRDDLGMTARRYVSQAGLSKDWFRSQCTIPAVGKIPPRALAFALNSYAGGWFEVLRRGYTPVGHSIDLCSAYPAKLANLPDVTTGEWKYVDEYHEDALLGYYLANVYITTMNCAPLPYRLNSIVTIRPVGVFATYLSKSEYEAYRDDVTINIVKGMEYYDPDPIYPFKAEIERLYARKATMKKNSMEYQLVKIILNSFYGCQYEKIPQDNRFYVGKLFNPIYAAEVTAATRAEIWKVVRNYQDHIISIATDGIILDKKPNIPYGKDLGQWDYEGSGEVVTVRSGIYKLGNKSRNRGIRSVDRLHTPHGDYNSLYDYFEAIPDITAYPITVTRPLNIGECLMHYKKYSPEMINVFTKDSYNLKINNDPKRIWDDNFWGGGDLLEREIRSKPLLLGIDGPELTKDQATRQMAKASARSIPRAADDYYHTFRRREHIIDEMMNGDPQLYDDTLLTSENAQTTLIRDIVEGRY